MKRTTCPLNKRSRLIITMFVCCMESRDPENAANDVRHLNIRVLTTSYHELERLTFCLIRQYDNHLGTRVNRTLWLTGICMTVYSVLIPLKYYACIFWPAVFTCYFLTYLSSESHSRKYEKLLNIVILELKILQKQWLCWKSVDSKGGFVLRRKSWIPWLQTMCLVVSLV